MAAIYLEHPVHGKKVAIAEREAVYDEGNGWKRFDPNREVAYTEKVEEAEVQAPIVEATNAFVRKNRRRTLQR